MTSAHEISKKTTRQRTILGKVEEALIRHLDQALPTWVDIEAFPENPKQYDFANKDGVVLVHYAGSRYVEPQGQSTNQKRGMSWVLVLKTRSLNGEMGAYDVLEDIRQSLQGTSFEGGGPLRMLRDDLISEEDGVWQWEIIVAMPVDAVAKRAPARSGLMRPVAGRDIAAPKEPVANIGA